MIMDGEGETTAMHLLSDIAHPSHGVRWDGRASLDSRPILIKQNRIVHPRHRAPHTLPKGEAMRRGPPLNRWKACRSAHITSPGSHPLILETQGTVEFNQTHQSCFGWKTVARTASLVPLFGHHQSAMSHGWLVGWFNNRT